MRGALPAAGGVVVALLTVSGSVHAGSTAARTCATPRASPAYTARIARTLRSGADVWGQRLLAAPSYAAARRNLEPLLYAHTSGGRTLTESGVYYLPFAQPLGAQGAGSVELHVADGGEILAGRADGARVRTGVGAGGRERYGSCLQRLSPARLDGGWLPILETSYRDAGGVTYRQESFAARSGSGLASYIRVAADARGRPGAVVRLSSTRGHSLSFRVPAGTTRTFWAAWSRFGGARVVPGTAYDAAKADVGTYWRARLAEGASFRVPDTRVMNAERSVLVQNLSLTWRYSIGNPYEEFSFPESVDDAQVMAAYGFTDVSRSMLRVSLTRRPQPYANWKRGTKLLASATQFRLAHDRAYLDFATPVLRGYVRALARQLPSRGPGLLARERYSSDIADQVLGLHAQAVAWQGLLGIAAAWRQTGRTGDAALAARTADRLGAGLRAALRQSQRRLGDGSLFVPVRLRDDEPAYPAVTATRSGSYWNLVAPYALASGLIRPGSPQARGALRYLALHGARLLGLVRASAFALYRDPQFPTSGTDEVYGLNAVRFLADNGEADQIALRLYGELAAAMTDNTFVSGEGATITPLDGQRYRSMYLPPSSATNAAYLETLRSTLLHETRNARTTPDGLELAPATPRPWLAAGKTIAVDRAPTSFGPLSYTLASTPGVVRATVVVPSGAPAKLTLHVRLPRGERLTSVRLDGRPYSRLNRSAAVVDLSGLTGTLTLEVRHT